MIKKLSVSLSNEGWKYLYVLLSGVYCTNVDDMIVLNDLFASFEDVAREFDKKRMETKNDVEELKHMFDQQMRNGASKEQKQMTLNSVDKLDKEQMKFAASIVSIEIEAHLIEYANTVLLNLLQTDLLDDKRRAKGLSGRFDIKNAVEIFNEFKKVL